MTQPGFHLSEALTVKPVADGQVSVTVLLPADLVTDYCRFLEALTNFFRAVDRKTSHAFSSVRVAAPEAIQETNRHVATYHAHLISAFDGYIASGLDRHEAVKRVAADLRAVSHPWCSLHVVQAELVVLGRGGSPGRPRRGQP